MEVYRVYLFFIFYFDRLGVILVFIGPGELNGIVSGYSETVQKRSYIVKGEGHGAMNVVHKGATSQTCAYCQALNNFQLYVLGLKLILF